MSRLRMIFMTAAMMLPLAALTLSSLAQPPGRGGGGGGRGGFGGPGGGFGGPGGGFGGPGGGSLLQLASNDAVQEDLKLKDKQKAQIKSLSDKYNAQMQELRTQMGMGGPGGPGGPGGAQGNRQGRGGNGQNGQGGFGGAGGGGGDGGQAQDPNAQAGGGGGRGNRGNRNQNGQGGVPEDPAVVAQRNEQRQMAREAMNGLRQASESSLAKILDKSQVTRLKQISLQLEGTPAVLCQIETHPHGDMVDKLQIDEAQYSMIQEAMSENRNAERVTRKTRGEVFKNAFARLTPVGANGGQSNGGNGGGGGGNNGNGNNGRNGGGRGGRGNFDPEAMKKVMESPEVKAQMEEIQSQEEKLTAQLTNAIFKILSPRQRTTFKKMLGAPFDRSKMFTGGPWGGRGGAAGKNQATTSKAAAASNDDDDDDAPKANPSTTAAPAKAKPSASTAKKKSLRELRGEPSGDN